MSYSTRLTTSYREYFVTAYSHMGFAHKCLTNVFVMLNISSKLNSDCIDWEWYIYIKKGYVIIQGPDFSYNC